jgi:hypothetical protein
LGRLRARQPIHPDELVSRADDGAQRGHRCDRGVWLLILPQGANEAAGKGRKGSKMGGLRWRGWRGPMSAHVLRGRGCLAPRLLEPHQKHLDSAERDERSVQRGQPGAMRPSTARSRANACQKSGIARGSQRCRKETLGVSQPNAGTGLHERSSRCVCNSLRQATAAVSVASKANGGRWPGMRHHRPLRERARVSPGSLPTRGRCQSRSRRAFTIDRTATSDLMDDCGARNVSPNRAMAKKAQRSQPDESCRVWQEATGPVRACSMTGLGAVDYRVPINRHVRPARSPSSSTAAMDFTIPYSAPWGLI